jgi:hypothetical protein
VKNEEFCPQLNIYFKRHVGFMSKRTIYIFYLKIGAAGFVPHIPENQSFLMEYSVL